MHSNSDSVKGRPLSLPRDRVIRAYAVCRDTLELTHEQTWRLLRGLARGRHIAAAERLYNERSS